MHTNDPSPWQHTHHFHTRHSGGAEQRTRWVLALTLVTMALEISAGWWSGSLALLADGWHMSSHALAIGLSVFAYAAARRLAGDTRFAFGTWKIEVLAGFASALLLLGVAVLMVLGAVERLLNPQPIHYLEAIGVAVLGLTVNVASALMLGHASGHDHHHHGHDHGHAAAHDGHLHEDLNLRAAYLHVLADAATSVLAIAALGGGWLWGWDWLDPLTAMVGAVLVALWAKGLLVQTGKVLLDREMDAPVVAEIRDVVQDPRYPGHTRVADLHVWRVGQAAYACAITVVTHDRQLTPAALRQRLAVHEEIAHCTIEIQHCGSPDDRC
ncbi:MAG: CDF family Co(II)/Ni(II) efflux transporter DmeF [Pseudomonadota bacterium]|nr:CDF family Co(II)/Ni(II) efflux transporter DmeF [Pseudomonadota bacterium]